MIKIAIDSGPLSSGHSLRGIGVYTRELLKAMKMDGVYVSKTDISKYDVVHFTSFKPFEVSIPLSKPKRTKFVLTIYDLIPLIYPDHYPSGVRGWVNFQINKYLINKNVDAIITISETSKKDICRFLGVDPKKVHVVYLASRSMFKKMKIGNWKTEVKKQYGLPDRFALYVGDVNYNKNISGVINEAKKLNLPLVIVGKQALEIEKMDLNHPELKHLKGIDWSKIIRLGFVPDEDLVKIYNLADIYLQMSFYEGFGLPLVEAKACGTPVKFFKTQALVEIMDLEGLSWEKTAKETLKVYENA